MLDFIKRRLPSDKAALQAVAEGSRVPFHTLIKIANGATENPRIMTVQALYNYLREQEAA